jgi:hypothetical protein
MWMLRLLLLLVLLLVIFEEVGREQVKRAVRDYTEKQAGRG